jgi:hypothetical protein
VSKLHFLKLQTQIYYFPLFVYGLKIVFAMGKDV